MNYHNMYPTKGYRSLKKNMMTDTGWIVSYYLMYQCFKELGICSKARRKDFRRPKGISDKYPNIIKGDWFMKGPFEQICSDTTMIIHKVIEYNWNYHVDVYNNEIVDSDVANHKYSKGVMNHLRSL